MTKTKRKKPTSEPEDKLGALLARIKPVSEIQTGTSGLFYGRAGSGKTTLACTFPKPLLLLDIKDAGTDSVVDVEGVEGVGIETWEELELMYWHLKGGEHEFKTVVLDTITQMQSLAIIEAKARNNKDADAMMTKQMWGEASALLRTWLINYRNLALETGINVVFLAQDRVNRGSEDEDADSDDQLDPEVGPALMPSVAKEVNAAVKLLVNTYITEKVSQKGGKIRRRVEYRARLGPHAYYVTKVRSPKGSKVPGSIKNPDYDKLLQVMKGEIDGEEE